MVSVTKMTFDAGKV